MIDNNTLLNEIPSYKDWITIKPITKGWSTDKKFYIEDNLEQKYVLRLADIKELPSKKEEYANMKILASQGVPMSIPVGFGICGNESLVYSLLSWVEGEDADLLLPNLPENKQYELGVQAGKILKKIHSIPAPKEQEPWQQRYLRKNDIVLDKYLNCGVTIDGDQKVIKFIKDNIHHIENVEQTFQHGDFHVGNMLIKDDKLSIIDFNRAGFGDPWEEYDRFVFTWNISTSFAKGQIESYFNHQVPDKFFRIMALYNARNAIASIQWSIPFGEKDLKVAIDNAKKIIESYNGFTTHIPNWY